MDKKDFIKKLDDGVSSLRDVLRENDGSTLKAIASSANQGFRMLKSAFAQNEKAQKAMSEIKKQFDEVEKAVKKGDRKLSAKLLAAVEKKIKSYKEKFDSPDTPKTGAGKEKAKPVKALPAAKTSAKPKKPATAAKTASAKKASSAKAKTAAKPKTASSTAAKKPATERKPARPVKAQAKKKG
ncbi:MAG: hypothetical protein LIP28_00945 [Deltaproteobacteria bacterium]|nr:hypothetical protein [Deltaproteobacteria bacterium]